MITRDGFKTSFTGPDREQPHRVLGGSARVTGDASAPGGAAPFAATREHVLKPLLDNIVL
jgi:hypothetical protein